MPPVSTLTPSKKIKRFIRLLTLSSSLWSIWNNSICTLSQDFVLNFYLISMFHNSLSPFSTQKERKKIFDGKFYDFYWDGILKSEIGNFHRYEKYENRFLRLYKFLLDKRRIFSNVNWRQLKGRERSKQLMKWSN